MAKQIAADIISKKAVRFAMLYRNSKTLTKKVNVSAALALLSIATHMPTADANKLIGIAETLATKTG